MCAASSNVIGRREHALLASFHLCLQNIPIDLQLLKLIDFYLLVWASSNVSSASLPNQYFEVTNYFAL
jgi:hypothetical protein